MHLKTPLLGRLGAILMGVAIGLAPGIGRAAPVVIHASSSGPGSAVLELDADELVTMTKIPFRLSIRDAAGQPLTGADVRCDMTMPAMAMPENRPKVTEHTGGAYQGELIFTCAQGAWRITCLAEKADGFSQTVVFDIPRVRMK